jgi:prepilin-type processing-associated H-X9-DG protein
MVTHVWMDPGNYQGGDSTDQGWATKNNRRSHILPKWDRDATGDTSYLGGPYPGWTPALFADGHVANLRYTGDFDDTSWNSGGSTVGAGGYGSTGGGTSGEQYTGPISGEKYWARSWAFVGGEEYNDEGDRGRWIKIWREYLALIASGGSDADKTKQVRDYLAEYGKSSYLSKEEQDLLKRLDSQKYDEYEKDSKNRMKQWQDYVVNKASQGEPLSVEEKTYYDSYLQDKTSDYRKEWEKETRKKGDAKEPLTKEEQDYYDKVQKDRQNKADREQWEKDVIAKGKAGGGGGGGMTDAEKKYWDKYLADQKKKEKEAWQKDTIAAGKAGDKLDANQQAYYDQYVQNERQKEQQQKLKEWKDYVIKKGDSKEQLTADEKQYYDAYKEDQLKQKSTYDKQTYDMVNKYLTNAQKDDANGGNGTTTSPGSGTGGNGTNYTTEKRGYWEYQYVPY